MSNKMMNHANLSPYGSKKHPPTREESQVISSFPNPSMTSGPSSLITITSLCTCPIWWNPRGSALPLPPREYPIPMGNKVMGLISAPSIKRGRRKLLVSSLALVSPWTWRNTLRQYLIQLVVASLGKGARRFRSNAWILNSFRFSMASGRSVPPLIRKIQANPLHSWNMLSMSDPGDPCRSKPSNGA